MKKSTWKKLAACAMAGMMTAALLASCGGPGGSSAPEEVPSTAASATGEAPQVTTNQDREKVTIRFSQPNTVLDNTALIEKDVIKLAIENAVNVELVYESGFKDDYTNGLQTALIGGTAPDLFPNYGEPEKTSKWIKDGVVTDLGVIISADTARYPILNKIINSPEFKMYNEYYAGNADSTYALYAIATSKAFWGPVLYHKGALEKAGLTEPPKTLEEFIDFTNKAATQGTSGWYPRNTNLTSFNEIDPAFFAPNGTTVKPPAGGSAWEGFVPVGGPDAVEGDWKLMTTSEETKALVKQLAAMYKSGALDRGIGTKHDFDVAKVEFFDGKIASAGYAFGNPPSPYFFIQDWQKIPGNEDKDPMEEFALGRLLEGTAAKTVNYSAPYWMSYNWFVPDSCQHADRVLDLIEFLASSEGQSLIFDGVEGVTYTKEGDKIVPNAEGWAKEGEIYNITDGRQRYTLFCFFFHGGAQRVDYDKAAGWYEASLESLKVDAMEEGPLKDYLNKVISPEYMDEVSGFLPPYFTIIQFSPEMLEARIQMKEITASYIPAFITGQKDVDKEWDKYVQEYKAAGAEELEKEFNAARAEAKEAFEKIK